LPRNDIYVYSPEKNFELKLGLPEGSGLGALELSSGIDDENWAENVRIPVRQRKAPADL